MNYLFSALIGYLLGSIPTAFIFLKKFKRIDIRGEGSSNIGAFNVYRVTESKPLALSVFIIDALKGLFSVLLANLLFGDEFLISAFALFFAVTAHCYSPWLKFKGGRGIATGFGGAVMFAYPVIALWILFWLIAYLFRKNIHFSNIAATILTGAISIVNSDILNKYNKVPAEENWIFGLAAALILAVIMSRHINAFKEWFFHQKRNVRGKDK